MDAGNSTARVSRLGAPAGHLVSFAGWLAGAYLATMLLWVLVPMAVLGWKPLVIVSDSMEPLIRAGDVVVVESATATLGPGTVIAFEAGETTIVHRVVGLNADGSYETKGDANQRPDSTSVAPGGLVGYGRLVVPYVGMARTSSGMWWAAVLVAGAATVPAIRGRRRLAVVISIGVLVSIAATAAVATLSETTANTASGMSALVTEAPPGFDAACGLIGAGNVEINLSWTPSATSGITGYRILHDLPGGGVAFSAVGDTTSDTTTFTHTLNAALLGLGTHTYAVQALLGLWESAPSATDSVAITQLLFTYLCA